jgi:hypothetical protein
LIFRLLYGINNILVRPQISEEEDGIVEHPT